MNTRLRKKKKKKKKKDIVKNIEFFFEKMNTRLRKNKKKIDHIGWSITSSKNQKKN